MTEHKNNHEKGVQDLPTIPTDNTITILWDKDKNETYRFRFKKHLRSKYNRNRERDRWKDVYYGYFMGTAPEGLVPDIHYWLKEIEISKREYPQFREQYDLVEFNQDHIRSFLARNPMAINAAEDIRAGNQPVMTDTAVKNYCYAVEQPYSEVGNQDIRHMTIWERLEYIWQYCQALNELYESSTHVLSHGVIAHRDVKIQNGLILRGKTKFTLKLLDFSAVRFEDDSAHGTPASAVCSETGGQGTKPYVMSAENTCIEIVTDQFTPSVKTDVFALGTMLASFFGYVTENHRNPNGYCCSVDPTDNPNNRVLKKHETLVMQMQSWQKLDNGLPDDGSRGNWMEIFLHQIYVDFHWGDPPGSVHQPSQELLEQVRRLVFDATRVEPDKRIGMAEFQERIQELHKSVPEERGTCPKLYEQPESILLVHQKVHHKDHAAQLVKTIPQIISCSGTRFPMRIFWYQNPVDGLYDKYAEAQMTLVTDASELQAQLNRHTAEPRLNARSLTDAVANLYYYYVARPYEHQFSGSLQLVTFDPIHADHLQPVRISRAPYSLSDFMYWLSDLSTSLGNNAVYVHSPGPDSLPEELALCNPQHLLLAPPEAAPKQEGEPRNEPEPKPAAKPMPDPSTLYLRNSEEGLFFLLEDGSKIYVSRKKPRR